MRTDRLPLILLPLLSSMATDAFIINPIRCFIDPFNRDLSTLAVATNAGHPLDFSDSSILSYSGKDAASKSSWYSEIAVTYQQYRPAYSDEIVSYMLQRCTKLNPSHTLLEIGSGPGTATKSFAGLVKNMTCLEPNSDFCTLARQTVGQEYSNINIVQTSLEEYTTNTTFDAILAASSIHWVEPAVARAKCASLLKDGGSLLLLWNNIVQPTETVVLALEPIYRKHALHLYQPYRKPGVGRLDLMRDIGKQLTLDAFENLQFGYMLESVEWTAFDYCRTLSTYSPYFSLATKEELFRDISQYIDTHLGGKISLTYEISFQTATKIPSHTEVKS